jgi:hypothetical protein
LVTNFAALIHITRTRSRAPRLRLLAWLFVPLLNFEWVAGQGDARENPKVVQLCEQSSWPGA